MNAIHEKVLQQAVKSLNAIGLKYAIQLPDEGGIIGELVVYEEPQRSSKKVIYRWKEKIKTPIQKLAVGDVFEFSASSDCLEELESLQATSCYYAREAFWSGNYLSTRIAAEHKVQLMRLA